MGRFLRLFWTSRLPMSGQAILGDKVLRCAGCKRMYHATELRTLLSLFADPSDGGESKEVQAPFCRKCRRTMGAR